MKKTLLFLIAGIVILFGAGDFVQASELNFAVNPIIPENQIDKDKTYFDLELSPGQTQTLEVQLKNDTDKELTVEASINSATTNLNGVVEYGPNDIKPDSSLAYNLKDYAGVAQEIKIPSKQVITVPIDLKMPEQTFDGVMAGGITFKEKNTESTDPSADQKGLAIKNEYSYVIALVMRQNTTPVQPDLQLLTVEPSQVNARNVINIGLQNPTASYLNQLKLSGKITKKGSQKMIYAIDSTGLQMAPNSNFSYPVSLNGQKLEPGDYHLDLTAYGMKSTDGPYKAKDENGQEISFNKKWTFTKDFTIKDTVAEKLNKKDVSIEKPNNMWLYLLIGGLVLIILVLLFFLLFKRKKRDEEEKKS